MLANLWFYRALWLTCYIETVFHVIDFLSLPKLVPQLCAFKKALVKNVEEAGTEGGGGGGERVTMKCLYFCYLVVQWPQTGQMGLIFNRNKALMWLTGGNFSWVAWSACSFEVSSMDTFSQGSLDIAQVSPAHSWHVQFKRNGRSADVSVRPLLLHNVYIHNTHKQCSIKDHILKSSVVTYYRESSTCYLC